MKRYVSFFVACSCLLLVASTVLVSCKHEAWHPVSVVDTTGNGGGSDSTNNSGNDTSHYIPKHVCSPDSVYFTNDIFPLIISNCTDSVHGCHSAGFHEDGGPLVTYAQIKKNVSTTNPTKSKLYTVLKANGEEKMPRAPFSALTSAQMDMILKWIQQGALNNSCDGNCDTTNVTFAATVYPVIKAACTGCHSGSDPSGKIALSTYVDIKLQVTTGKLLGAITRADGYVAMPPTATLSDCDLTAIKIWIRNGALNN
jgi:hypothetical protein